MILKQLSLLNYKNFEQQEFTFNPKLNGIVGANGVGKTNVLDAIYHLSFGKSYFNPVSSQNIKHGQDYFVIDAILEREQKEEKLVCSLKKGAKKIIKRNGKVYDKISDHIGFMPLVMISPADRDLITEGSDTRRKFIDGVISQSDRVYLEQLLQYNKLLAQRNALLKYFSLNQSFDKDTLLVYDQQLSQLATPIYEKRRAFLDQFTPIFQQQFSAIVGGVEQVGIRYQSSLEQGSLDSQLLEKQKKDRALQYTSVGTHKDDLIFELEGHVIKKFGSQGQQKSFLIALKLAQFHFIKQKSKTTPILLLDDIFDKLDASRVAQLIHLVNAEEYGQIFISDTHEERTKEVMESTQHNFELIALS
ncbi:MAG: DNA replication/repair protein RecF [Flavobacteriaceae bacterium]|nr:DNA replication/repair protein RecF [Flavobacteriaceae bacterium]MCI5088850.1 DNA replication/repair protein RecF [Flavobacteriaceae bacterium]